MDRERRETESLVSVMRERWVVINVLYMLLLVSHDGWLRPVVASGAKWTLVVLLLVLAFDVVTSRSFRNSAHLNLSRTNTTEPLAAGAATDEHPKA